jgi:hypothetical protein
MLARRIVNKLPMGVKPNRKAEIAKSPQKRVTPNKPSIVSPKKSSPAIVKKAPEKPKQKLPSLAQDSPGGEKPIISP